MEAGARPGPGAFARRPEVARGATGPVVPRHRIALIAGVVLLGVVLVLNVPGVAEVRQFRSPATILSHVALTLIAGGLHPRFRGWIVRVAALSSRQRVLSLAVALVGPLAVIAAVLALTPSYGHELFTREWGIVEPLQFVLWLTAAWLAFERARYERRASAEDRVFRLTGWGCLVLASEEVDYFGIATLIARLAGVPQGRIGGQHIGGLHDVVNMLGKTSLLLGLLALGVVAALVVAWAVSRGLHRVAIRELLSSTSLPLIGTVGFLAFAQLADIDHPALSALFGDGPTARKLREEPMELLAAVCLNASLLAKLTARLRGSPIPPDRAEPRIRRPLARRK